MHPLEDRHAVDARDLLIGLRTIPLRTLDALHLAVARAIDAGSVATADAMFSAAATSLHLEVEWFGR